MVKFLVNGEEFVLSLEDENGIDWSQEFVASNVGGGMSKVTEMEQDDDGRWIVSREGFAWWERVFADYREFEELVREYEARFGRIAEEVASVWSMNSDLDQILELARYGLEVNFGPLNPSHFGPR